MRRFVSLPAIFQLTIALTVATPATSAEPVSFKRDVAPILRDKCVACHGSKKAEGGYRADSYRNVMKEGDSGLAGFTSGDLDDSEVFRRVVSEDVDERMPLEADPLESEAVGLLRRWIEEGAKFDGEDPAAPLVKVIPPTTHPEPPQEYAFPVPVVALKFGPDGEQIFASGYHEVTVWSTRTGELQRRIKNVGERTHALSFSTDGRLLAVGSGSPGRLGEARVFEVSSGKLITVLGKTGDVVLDVAFSPDSQRLAVAAADGLIRVFDTATGEEQLVIGSHSDWVAAVAWSADGQQLASASRDKTAKVFNAQTGNLLITYSGHGEPVEGVAFHPNGKDAYSSGADKKIHLWKIEDAKRKSALNVGDSVYKLSASEKFLFAASADGTVRQFNIESQKEVRSLTGHQDWVLSVAYHDKSRLVASGGFDGRIQVWSADDGSQVAAFSATPGPRQ